MERSSHDTKGFRAWYYFRMGWGYYFAFLFAAINTLTVTYFLAIENYPALEVIFPTFEIYIIIICSIGIPLLVAIGYAHYKRTKARKAEVDILTETNPYMIRVLVNSELTMRLNLKIMERLINISKDGKVSQKELEELAADTLRWFMLFLNHFQLFGMDEPKLLFHLFQLLPK